MIVADDASIARILGESRSIAVVGLSPKPERPSHGVARYLLGVGYRIIPVNPGQRQLLGLTCYSSLIEVPEPIDVVDCFRRSEDMPALAEQAVAVGAKVLWMQLGVISEEAAAIAAAGGLQVVMDRCTKIEHAHLIRG